MATACWAFIVAKSPRLETAPLLHFPSLRAANIKLMHNLSTIPSGYPVDVWGGVRACPHCPVPMRAKRPWKARILSDRWINRPSQAAGEARSGPTRPAATAAPATLSAL